MYDRRIGGCYIATRSRAEEIMAFEVLCKNCGCYESDHIALSGDVPETSCENWEAERPLTNEERKELKADGVEATH